LSLKGATGFRQGRHHHRKKNKIIRIALFSGWQLDVADAAIVAPFAMKQILFHQARAQAQRQPR
jgi:hypothetical protein